VEKSLDSNEATEGKQWFDLVKKSIEPAHVFKQKKQSRYIVI